MSDVRSFWEWFARNADLLGGASLSGELIEEVDERVRALHPSLSWEIGPGNGCTSSFTISPSGDANLLEMTRRIVDLAPVLDAWEYFPARRPKLFSRAVFSWTVSGRLTEIDASGWRCMLYAFAEGDVDVVVSTGELTDDLAGERDHLASFAVEAVLGEEVMLQIVRKVEGVERFSDDIAGLGVPLTELLSALSHRRQASRPPLRH